MKIIFEVVANIEGVDDLTEEHRAAILEQIVGYMSPHEIGEWVAGSKWREQILLGVEKVRDGDAS